MSSIAEAHHAYEDYRRQELIRQAAALDVELTALDPHDYPGLHFSYRPQIPDWPEIHLSKYPYDRWWRFAVELATFADVIRALGAWRGDPGGEPRGYTLAWDGREDYDFTR